MSYKTKGEIAKYHREIWYPRNKKRRMELNNAWRKRRRLEFREMKKKLKCKVCGEKEPYCLDFHHLDPKKKDMNINISNFTNHSLKKVEKELKKCVVLCSNCHRKVHAGIIKLPALPSG